MVVALGWTSHAPLVVLAIATRYKSCASASSLVGAKMEIVPDAKVYVHLYCLPALPDTCGLPLDPMSVRLTRKALNVGAVLGGAVSWNTPHRLPVITGSATCVLGRFTVPPA